MNKIERNRRGFAWLAVLLAGLIVVVAALPAGAQAGRTRPGSSSGSSSGGSSGGSASRAPSSPPPSTSSGPTTVNRTRPSGSSSSGRSVVDRRRPGQPHRPGYGDRHGHYPYGGYYWSPWSYSWWLGWSWWYPDWPGYGYPYGYGAYPVNVYPGRVEPTLGALDTDVYPARTEVWINGQYVGFVDQFDGFPRYLWLEKGTYDVVFYYPGYKTLARQYTVYPGMVIDVEDHLQPGEAIHPDDLAPKTTPTRDARIQEERERSAAAEAQADWQERARAGREAAREGGYEEPAPQGDAVDARSQPGRVFLAIQPPDAAVYLDGRFVGTGQELSGLAAGLLVDPGAHKLSVVRPGHTSRNVDFEIASGEDRNLDVQLVRE